MKFTTILSDACDGNVKPLEVRPPTVVPFCDTAAVIAQGVSLSSARVPRLTTSARGYATCLATEV